MAAHARATVLMSRQPTTSMASPSGAAEAMPPRLPIIRPRPRMAFAYLGALSRQYAIIDRKMVTAPAAQSPRATANDTAVLASAKPAAPKAIAAQAQADMRRGPTASSNKPAGICVSR